MPNSSSLICSGRLIVNSVPVPTSLLTSIVPPIRSTIFFEIAIPRPLPSVLSIRLSFSRVKGLKISLKNSGLIPIPVSLTVNMNQALAAFSDAASSISKLTVPPGGVNLEALESTLISTCRRRSESQHSCSCLICRRRTSNCCCLALTLLCMIETIVSITSGSSITSSARVIFPLSIFDISSTSLIRPRRC